MKLLYVISDRNIGGAGIWLLNLLRHLDRRSFSVTVALPFQSRLRERLVGMRVRVRELEQPCEVLSLSSVCELVSVIRAERPDTVHTNAAVAARVAGRLCGCRVFFTRHCAYPTRAEATPFSARLANRWLTDRAIATAAAAARDLTAMGIPQKRITVIRNGSDPIREVEAEETAAWRRRLGLTEDDFCVGICARLETCKGHDVLLRAARLAVDRLPQVRLRFLIVGDGSRRTELECLARSLGLCDAVRFVGFLDDVAPIYRLLRLHVNASRGTETSCLAVSEAMSAGVPQIVSDYGGNREMLRDSIDSIDSIDGAAGLIVPVGDVTALADAICRVASDLRTEQRLRRAAYRRYCTHFTARRMADAYAREYQRGEKDS